MDSDGSFCRKTVLVFDFFFFIRTGNQFHFKAGEIKTPNAFRFFFSETVLVKARSASSPALPFTPREADPPRAVQFDFCFKITLGLSTYSPSVVFNWIINRCMCPSTAVYKIKVCFLCSFFSFTPQFEQRAHRYNNRESFGTLNGVFRELRLSLYANALKSLRSRIGKWMVLV